MKHTAHRGVYYRIGKDGRKTYYLRIIQDGRQTWRAAGSSLSNALKLQAQIRIRRGDGKLGIPSSQPIAFAELAEEYWQYYRSKAKPRNWARVQSILKQLVGFFGAVQIKRVTPWTIENYVRRRRAAGVSARTVNLELDYLRTMLNKALEWGFLETVPKVKRLPVQGPRRARILTDAEIRYVLANVSEDHWDAIALALDTGMRFIEIYLLRASNWHKAERLVVLEDTKSLKTREIPLTARAQGILERRFARLGDRLFSESSPGPLSYRFHRERQKLKDIPPWRFHDLRHTFITRLLQGGVDPYTVCELAGHSKLEMTARYAHTSLDRKQAAIAMMDPIPTKKVAKVHHKRT